MVSRMPDNAATKYNISKIEDGDFDFCDIEIIDLLKIIKLYFPHHPQMLEPINPIFNMKSKFTGYDDTDCSHLFRISSIEDGFSDNILALFYFKLKGRDINDSRFKNNPIIEHYKIYQLLDLSPEDFYSFSKQLNKNSDPDINMKEIDFNN